MSARVCMLGRNANLVINGPGVLNICITTAHSNVYIVYFAQPQTHPHPVPTTRILIVFPILVLYVCRNIFFVHFKCFVCFGL